MGVATPQPCKAPTGRMLDHAGQRRVNLSHIQVLVLDEANRMLDMGLIHDIRKVLAGFRPIAVISQPRLAPINPARGLHSAETRL